MFVLRKHKLYTTVGPYVKVYATILATYIHIFMVVTIGDADDADAGRLRELLTTFDTHQHVDGPTHRYTEDDVFRPFTASGQCRSDLTMGHIL